MSQIIKNNKTQEQIEELMRYYNDVLHDALKRDEIVVVARHKKDDPRKFTIIADNDYDKALEGIDVIFNSFEDFKKVFPDFAAPPPVTLGPNMELNKHGIAVPIHKDPYEIKKIYSIPPPENPELHSPNHALDGKTDSYWGVNVNPATLLLDLGEDSDIGTIWITWHAGDQRKYKFTVGVALDSQFTDTQKTFTIIDELRNKYSSGISTEIESYNLSDDPEILTKARYVMIKVYGNDKDNWASINYVKVTKAVAIINENDGSQDNNI